MVRYPVIYVHIHYDCGHEAIRPVRQAKGAARERWTYERCQHCTDQLARRYAIVHEVEREQESEVAI